MSVYPKRVIAGENIFVHTRAKVRSPKAALIRVLLEDPAGVSTLLHEHQPLLFPMPSGPEQHENAPDPEVRRVHSLYLSARQVSGCDGDVHSMLASLEKTRDSVHFHLPHRLPSSAIPGKYHVHIEMHATGRLLRSDTARDAFFFVEKLALDDVVRTTRGGRARVVNLGPHRVPARIVGVGKRAMWHRNVVLSPGLNELCFRGRQGFLSYSEGRHVLFLAKNSSPRFIRDERRPWRVCPATKEVLIFGQSPNDEGFVLRGAAARIWLSGAGLTTRDQAIELANEATYGRLLADGLIEEVP